MLALDFVPKLLRQVFLKLICNLISFLKKTCKSYTPSSSANSTLIILVSEMFENFKNYFFQIKKYCEG